MVQIYSVACLLFWLEQLLQFSACVHISHDVGAADKFAVDIELGNGGPVAVFLYALADGIVFKHIDGVDFFGVNATGFEQLYGTPRETTHGKTRTAFHEQDDRVGFNKVVDVLLCFVHGVYFVINRWCIIAKQEWLQYFCALK